MQVTAAIVVLLSLISGGADDFDLASHEMPDTFKFLLEDFSVISLELWFLPGVIASANTEFNLGLTKSRLLVADSTNEKHIIETFKL